MKSSTRRALPLTLFALLGANLVAAADVANMSGTWKLNLEKSKFEKSAPLSVLLKIEHNEPSFKYSGTVQRDQTAQPDTFEYSGAIDEKIHPVTENGKSGRTIKFARKSANTIQSWSSDATMEEHAETTISADGKTLTRNMHVKQSNGLKRQWVEVYDKQS